MSTRRPSAFAGSLLLAFACLLVYVALPNVGNAARAAMADGVAGSFTASRLTCIAHPGHETCEWSGTFKSADGSVEREDITLYGSGRGSLAVGRSAEAVDVGNPGRVYRPGGSREWIFTAALLLVGYGLLALLAHRHLMPPRTRARA
ncbi:hypothetical protein LG634_12330 [Streptomyces bambusae]|uniref:hypothetical protein n=1 Tax=Streptomyces bambusae TaxID=1550616 RepID=UPI001CFC4BE3|nr:hypothetical protein [Streptomyces bambusae]MCB5165617.1 hypothetical protein [Streptomyces bambusae]